MKVKMKNKKFTHVKNSTDYMRIIISNVEKFFGSQINKKKILDIPAGNGWISSALNKLGAQVTSADINEEKKNYVIADMEMPLPFKNNQFDCVICAEGIEHVLNPEALFSELARVLKKGGLLIISTPNVQNFFTRLQIACTGYLYQFHSFHITPPKKNEMRDRGHITPIFYTQLRYFSHLHKLKILQPDGDRFKRVIGLPLFLPFILFGYYWSYRDWKRAGANINSKEIIQHLFNMKTLFSRSFIFRAIKQ